MTAHGDNSASAEFYNNALSMSIQNVKAMLWFRNNVLTCASYHKGKFCTICFDSNMVHILNKSASEMGHNYHTIVKHHDIDDTKVWHRPKVVEGIPNIYHADSVCNNTNITCGECISNTMINMNYVTNRMVVNKESIKKPSCYRAHCVKQNEDGSFEICNDHHSRVVCPYKFNKGNHDRVFK